MTEKPRVCFYGLYCYPLFNPNYNFKVGGWETRVSLIAKELARRGNIDVTMIVADYSQPHVEYREGVQLISWIGKKGGSPAEDDTDNNNEIQASPQTDFTPEDRWGEIPDQNPRNRESYKFFTRSSVDWFSTQSMAIKTKVISRFLAQIFLGVVKDFYSDCLVAFKYTSIKTLIKSPIRALIQVMLSFRKAINSAHEIFDILDLGGFHIVWRDDVDILDEANADIYVVAGNHRTSAMVAYYCKLRNKGYIFLAGSDYDYRPEYKTNPNRFDMYGESFFLKTYAIEQATSHIVQTPRQANLLKQGYGRSSTVILNPINLDINYPRSATPEAILWVGKADERIKRPSLILELARRLPDQPFVVILNKAFADVYALCLETARNLPNVTLIESVPFDQVEQFFAAARLFVNTSVFEGFPNTFLQAAKYSVPIIASDVDPGGMLSQHGCGITCGGDFELVVESIQRILTDDNFYKQMADAALRYVQTFHDKNIIVAQYEKAFQNVLSHNNGIPMGYENKPATD